MEALTGASVAALTVYDMLKGMVFPSRFLEKSICYHTILHKHDQCHSQMQS